MQRVILILAFTLFCNLVIAQISSWIRINQLGYQPGSKKIAVWCAKNEEPVKTFQLIDAASKKISFSGTAGKPFGAYGPFTQSHRLNFSSFTKPGKYYLQVGKTKSPEFTIDKDVYKGSADFCLRYMRQQRTGFNPFLKDSCHTHDGYVLYGEKAGIKDSTYIDVVGGWHDASDYLQYVTTSANATYHLLMAYRDFKNVFTDKHLANGLEGKNEMPDVLDEAKWGLDWLLKMHPREDWMFNQIADDRDHMGMRIPKQDSFYRRGYQRPAYFVSGEPQQRGKFMNNTTGTSSTAAKFASAFALGFELLGDKSKVFNHRKSQGREPSDPYFEKAFSAYRFAQKKLGVTQTASVVSPYIYAEDNWIDDMELAGAAIFSMTKHWISEKGFYSLEAFNYARQESLTPWLGADTAKHYQWYPFINIGHYELAKQLKGSQRDTIISYYKQGIQKVWDKAKNNAFYRGVPYIWCSNNLTTSFAIQCMWYRQLTGDKQFEELEQANFDWLFGLNPWGTSMVYGLPTWGDTPVDPHSAFTHIKNYPIDGGLIDGPVYGSIYKNLIGIKLYQPDEYAEFQSDLAVYHDDYGDYSTNEPTMDGTASLIYLLASKEAEAADKTSANIISQPLKKTGAKNFLHSHGAIIRGDTSQKQIAIVFTGDEFADGGHEIANVLKSNKTKASFFFTGRFYSNPAFTSLIKKLKNDGHYLGAHSDQHLLYCDWTNRDSLLVTEEEFKKDLLENYKKMTSFGISKKQASYFLPPYEWYNDTIAVWTKELDFQLINYTPGSLSHADYTTPYAKNYRSSAAIYQSIIDYEKKSSNGLNGAILLMHIGTDPKRTDKFYHLIPQLLKWLAQKEYRMVTLNQLLKY